MHRFTTKKWWALSLTMLLVAMLAAGTARFARADGDNPLDGPPGSGSPPPTGTGDPDSPGPGRGIKPGFIRYWGGNQTYTAGDGRAFGNEALIRVIRVRLLALQMFSSFIVRY